MTMNFYASNGRYWQKVLTRIGLVAVCVAVIVWFLPRNESQRLRYDVGKPWMYGSFIAKFDFPIYKTDEAIKAEQDSLMELFQPYFRYDTTVETTQLRKLSDAFGQDMHGLPK